MTILLIGLLLLYSLKCVFQLVCRSFTQMNWWFLMNKSTLMFWQIQVSRFRWLRYIEPRSGLSEWKQRRKYRLAHQEAVIESFFITMTVHEIIDIRTLTPFYYPVFFQFKAVLKCVSLVLSFFLGCSECDFHHIYHENVIMPLQYDRKRFWSQIESF